VELSSEQIGTLTGIGKSAAYRAVKAAIDQGFLVNNETRDIQRPGELQIHLREVLTDEAAAAWPRTSTGKLTTRRQQLQLNADLPAIDELLKVRALRKMIEAFGDNLINAVNPVTGRLHTSFMIVGASTGRFSARGPNLQQMPKSKQKGFRKIFAAPAGQLVMALDYSQIELRAVAEIVSEWAGEDSILRQSFAAGLDAHTATAMAMTGKTRPEDITPEERQMAKPCNFGLLYRMGNRGFYNYLRAGYQPHITYRGL
jgi:DNA polymerase I-like protein with 3'-5' exonuclease and polymerase domains